MGEPLSWVVCRKRSFQNQGQGPTGPLVQKGPPSSLSDKSGDYTASSDSWDVVHPPISCRERTGAYSMGAFGGSDSLSNTTMREAFNRFLSFFLEKAWERVALSV
jgi:hypothetical protein